MMTIFDMGKRFKKMAEEPPFTLKVLNPVTGLYHESLDANHPSNSAPIPEQIAEMIKEMVRVEVARQLAALTLWKKPRSTKKKRIK